MRHATRIPRSSRSLRMFSPGPIPLLLVALLGVGCGDPEVPTGDNALEVVEELRIGVGAGPEELMFGSVDHIAVGQDGSIFVADGQATVVRMFDADGAFVRNVGREGQGPGEFTDIMGVKVVPDGRLMVWDARATRLTFFDPGGDFVGTLPVPSSVWGEKSFCATTGPATCTSGGWVAPVPTSPAREGLDLPVRRESGRAST